MQAPATTPRPPGPRPPLDPDAARRLLSAAQARAAILVEGWSDQPAQRGRELHAQLRRFLGTRAGRKVRYGALLVDALELDRVPHALDLALAYVDS